MNILSLICLIFLFNSVFGLVKCPDKTSACPDGTTCCPLGDRTYGCCPIPKAVCCEDERHCCPESTVCDTAHGKCTHVSTGFESPMKKKIKSMKILQNFSDEEFQIPVFEKDESEENSEFDYPKVNSPRKSKKRNPFKTEIQVEDVTCQDGKSKCPSETTCCVLGGGIYGCCPVPNAVCCEDKLHCCPHNTKCDTAEGRCINPSTLEESPWYKKFTSTRIIQKPGRSLRPSARPCASGYCEGDQTCCSPTFARNPTCCPFSGGVCCRSGCCPKGYRCSKSGCVVKTEEITVIAPKSGLVSGKFYDSGEEYSKMCPDGSNCPLKSTCCQVEDEKGTKSYKCCPLTQGTCCEDSCCLRGFHCAGEGICERTALTKDLLKELFFDSI